MCLVAKLIRPHCVARIYAIFVAFLNITISIIFSAQNGSVKRNTKSYIFFLENFMLKYSVHTCARGVACRLKQGGGVIRSSFLKAKLFYYLDRHVSIDLLILNFQDYSFSNLIPCRKRAISIINTKT